MQHEKNPNEAAPGAVARKSEASGERIRKRDLDDVVGSWQEDPAFEEAVADQHKVDPEIWH